MLGIEILGFASFDVGIFLFVEAVSWVEEAPFLVSWNNLFFFIYPSISSDEKCTKREHNEEYAELWSYATTDLCLSSDKY